MVVWKLKSCPRCGGDVFVDQDFDTWFEQCLQCSHRRELDTAPALAKRPLRVAEGRRMSWTRR